MVGVDLWSCDFDLDSQADISDLIDSIALLELCRFRFSFSHYAPLRKGGLERLRSEKSVEGKLIS